MNLIVNDMVKVKGWDELSKSCKYKDGYGLMFQGFYFAETMKKYCNKEFKIINIIDDSLWLEGIERYCFNEIFVDLVNNNKYVILDIRSGELIIEDNNPYFTSLEDAQNYVLECEESQQLLNILEVSKVFECELNFKPKAL